MKYTSFYDISDQLGIDMSETLSDLNAATSSALGVPENDLPYLVKFLHGYCDAFAFFLSRECGYDVIARFVMSSAGSPLLIHAACAVPGGYMDIRGFTPTAEALFEEFESDIEETISSLDDEFGEGTTWIEDVVYDTEGFCDYCLDRPGDFDDCRDELDEYGRLPFFDDFYLR